MPTSEGGNNQEREGHESTLAAKDGILIFGASAAQGLIFRKRISAQMKMRHGVPMLLVLFFLTMTMAACNKSSSQNTNQNADQPTVVVPPQVFPRAKRYHLKGKVVSVDKQSKMLNVDGEAIPNFMDAMTMPYEVKPESELDKLSPGDSITADVVLENEKAWLENIAVTAHAQKAGKSQ